MASASPSPQPDHDHWKLLPAFLGFASAALGLLGRRRTEVLSPAPDLDRLSRLEKRFDHLEESVMQTQQATAELHREIFELLRTRGQESQS